MPEAIVTRKGIKPPISDQEALETHYRGGDCEQCESGNDYRSWQNQCLTILVGQVMKQTRGQAKADIVHTLLRKKLD